MNSNGHTDIKTNGLNGHAVSEVGEGDNPYVLRRRRLEEIQPEGEQGVRKASAANVDEGDEPAVETKPTNDRKQRLKFAGAVLLVLAGIGGFLYFRYFQTTKIEHQVKGKNQLSSIVGQVPGGLPSSEASDPKTLDAIKQSQEARRAGGQGQEETKPSVEAAPQKTTPPEPKLSIPGEYVEPRSGRSGTGEAGENGASTERSGYKTRGQPSHKLSSIYAVQEPKAAVQTSVLPANPNLRPELRTVKSEKAISLPPYGEMLPVRALGGLYTLRNSLARLELTQDIKGNGWEMRKGTVFVGQLQGGALDRAYLGITGFIDPGTNRLVKLTGEVLGSDGSPGMKGKRRQVSSRWSRVGNRIINGALGLGQAAIARGGGTTVVVGTSGLTNDMALLNTISNKEFVEVTAGATGYVMVTDLPDAIKGVDADPAKYLAGGEQLTDDELAELISNGNPAQIKAAMPRMTPEMRKIAVLVAGGQEK